MCGHHPTPCALGMCVHVRGGDVDLLSVCVCVCVCMCVVCRAVWSTTERQRSHLSLLLAEEYVLLGSLSAARKLLLQVAHTYRRYVFQHQNTHTHTHT